MPKFLSRTLLAFQIPAFRWLWISGICGAMNVMANSLTMGWLVLQLTDSPFWVGAVAFCRGIGQVGSGVPAGVMLDRYDKKRILIIAQMLNSALPLTIAFLVFTDQIALWHLLLASLLDGILTSIRAPAFNTINYQIVGSDRILNASAAMNLGFSLALVVGSTVTGALVDRFGEESGFFLAGSFGLLGVFWLMFVKGRFKETAATEPLLQAAAAGIRYVWKNIQLRKLLTLSLVMETFGFSYDVLLPVVARDVLGLGATGLGILSSSRGMGSTLGNLGIASLGDYEKKSRVLVTGAAGAGLFLIAFGQSPWYAASAAFTFMVGMMLASYDVTMKSFMLLLAGDEWRGRVQSIYTLTYGFVSIGGFLAGTVATAVGAPLALAVNGSMILGFVGVNRLSLLGLGKTSEVGVVSAD